MTSAQALPNGTVDSISFLPHHRSGGGQDLDEQRNTNKIFYQRSCHGFQMKHLVRYLTKYLSIFFLFCASAYAQQPWSKIIASSRAIDWSHAGLPATFPDGETTPNPWTPPTRTQCGPTLTPSGGDDVTQILNAFNGVGSFSSCTPPYVVLLGTGNFQIESFLRLGGANTRNNVTLRGGGPMNTTVTVASGQGMQVGACCGGGGAGALTSAASNYTVGQTSFLLQNVSGTPFVGAIAHFVQCDNGFVNSSSGQPLGTCTGSASDPLTVFHCSDAICAGSGNSDSTRQEDRQTVRITSATNTGGNSWTVTVSPGLYLGDWTFSQGATLAWDNQSSWQSIGIGIEDMTLRPFDSGNAVTIGNGGYADWMKGVREMAYNNNVIFEISDCSHCLAVNNYWFANDPSSIGNGLSLAAQQDSSSDSLFLNNIAEHGLFMDDGGGHQGEVVAYTYSRDSSGGGDGYQSTLFEHTPGSNLMLRESNQFGRINDDDTHGTHNLETDFRNNLNCADVPYDLGIVGGGFQYSSFARFANSVANAIGFGQPSYPVAKCATYQGAATDGYVWNLNYTNTPLTDTSGLTTASLMRWGNVSIVTQSTDTPANSGIRFVSSEVPTNLSAWPNSVPYQNSVPANNNLPCSFFLQGFSSTTCTFLANGGTGLSWWKVCASWTTFPTACAASTTPPFPANGPDVLAANGAPANYANDIPAAVAWKNLPIDTTLQSSFTVTSSSWSSGTETLTVAMPVPFPIGGFQLTGAPGACSPTSGVSYTGRPDGEIIITGSSSTTVKYALASNPGVSCTGTVKWPDVRQFDEKVYMNDPALLAPAPPTGLTIGVQ